MMWYLVVFVSAFIVDLIPVFAPPAWMFMVFLLVKFHLNPWAVLVSGVVGSTIGRYIFSLYVPKIADKLIKQHKQDELEFVGKKMSQKLWPSWLFVFIYTLTPLSTAALFTAAALAKVKAVRTVPPFFFGKFVSDAMMILAGRYAVQNLVHSTFSVKGIAIIVFSLVIIGGFLFVDWRMLLQKKKVQFNFKIWK
jgi:membrane protein DedA with SNARE-associated domain